MKNLQIFLAFLVILLVAAENADKNFEHPKNLGWKAPEGHREKRYGGWGGGYYPYYGGGYGGGYPYSYGNYGGSSWGTYSSYQAGGFSRYSSGGWGWGK